jgi:hypothetical protein
MLRVAGLQTPQLLNTGRSQHYDSDLANFVNIAPCKPYDIQTTSRLQYATQIGTVQFTCHQNSVKTFSLKNMYHLPACPTLLISLAKLQKHGLIFRNAEDRYGTHPHENWERSLLCCRERWCLPLDNLETRVRHRRSCCTCHREAAYMYCTEAYERLGHMAHGTIETLAHNGAALNFDIDLSTPIVECQVCTCAKTQGLPIAQRHRAL